MVKQHVGVRWGQHVGVRWGVWWGYMVKRREGRGVGSGGGAMCERGIDSRSMVTPGNGLPYGPREVRVLILAMYPVWRREGLYLLLFIVCVVSGVPSGWDTIALPQGSWMLLVKCVSGGVLWGPVGGL